MARLITITGKALSGEWGTEDESKTGIPVLRTTNFTNNGTVNFNNVVTRTISKKNLREKYLQNGDIIIEKSGGSDSQPVGRVIYFEGPENTYLFNNFTGLLRVQDQTRWLPRYVFYALFANYRRGGTRQFENKTTGLHNLKIDRYITEFDVPQRDPATQKQIYGILDRVHNIIIQFQQQLVKLDELTKARFVEMFDSGTFPTLTFGDTCVFLKNGANIKQVAGAKGYPITRIETLSNGVFNPNRLGYANITTLDQYENYILQRGDILISHINSAAYLGRAVQYKGELNSPVIHGMNLLCARLKDGYVPTYIEHYFKTPEAKNYISSITKKAVNQASLTTTDLKKLPVTIPPYNLQVAFDNFVTQVDKTKAAVQSALEKAQLLFDSLMQKYFG